MKKLLIIFLFFLPNLLTAQNFNDSLKQGFVGGLSGAVDNKLTGEFGTFLGFGQLFTKPDWKLPILLDYGVDLSGVNLGALNSFRSSVRLDLSSFLPNGFNFGASLQAGILLGKNSLGKILENAYDITVGLGIGYFFSCGQRVSGRVFFMATYTYSNIVDVVFHLPKNRVGFKTMLDFFVW